MKYNCKKKKKMTKLEVNRFQLYLIFYNNLII